MTYYFSKKPAKNSQIVWTITLSLIIVIAAISILFYGGGPLLNIKVPESFSITLRLISLVFIGYICIRTLNSHIKHPEPTTIWIPLGFIMLGISQYSQIIRFLDEGPTYGGAFIGSIVARFIALGIFLFVAYRTFHGSHTREDTDEKDRP
jgi:amino acid transporter